MESREHNERRGACPGNLASSHPPLPATTRPHSALPNAPRTSLLPNASPFLQPAAGACPPTPPRVVLVCGADVLHSMADPTLWRQDLLEVRGAPALLVPGCTALPFMLYN